MSIVKGPPKKRRVEFRIEAEILEQAKAMGLNVAEICRTSLRKAIVNLRYRTKPTNGG